MLNNLSIGEIAVFLGSVGVVSALFAKIFSQVYKVKDIEKRQIKLEERMDTYEDKQKHQKVDILKTVGETNEAVNLLCSAISVMIENELSDNKNKESLRIIKQKLDERKEIV